ncbi:MAG: NUDIX domain-containing protein [Hyphomicrobium sp.]
MSNLFGKHLARAWRRRLTITLGVQAVIVNTERRVLLVRHGYRPGWHFPGGGVEKSETVEGALRRELLEETGIVLKGAPQLFGLYAHFDVFPGDHIVLFYAQDCARACALPQPRDRRTGIFRNR